MNPPGLYILYMCGCVKKKKKKKKKRPTDRPYLKTPSARKTGFFFSSPYHIFFYQPKKKKKEEGSMSQWIEHQTMNTWMTPQCGFESPWCQISATLLVPLSKALYSNCSMVRRSRKAVSPVYMYLNIRLNISLHVKERHRLFKKSRGLSWYCLLYFKNTFTTHNKVSRENLVWTSFIIQSSTLGPEEKYSLSVRSA